MELRKKWFSCFVAMFRYHVVRKGNKFGARTLEQYSENIGAIGWNLSNEHFNELEEISKYPNRFIEKFRRSL